MSEFFMVIGAPKCATTTLCKMLADHEDITFSNPKEPLFFEYEYPLGLPWYIGEYFGSTPDTKLFGEGRARSISVPYIAPRVAEMMGKETKIIMMVRDPAKRWISEWAHWHYMRPGRQILGMKDAFISNEATFDLDYYNSEERVVKDMDIKGGPFRIHYMENGMYSYWYYLWLKHLPNIHVVCYEDFVAGDQSTWDELMSFLDLPESDMPHMPYLKKGPEIDIDLDLLIKIHNRYKSSVKTLSQITGVNYGAKWGYK